MQRHLAAVVMNLNFVWQRQSNLSQGQEGAGGQGRGGMGVNKVEVELCCHKLCLAATARPVAAYT